MYANKHSRLSTTILTVSCATALFVLAPPSTAQNSPETTPEPLSVQPLIAANSSLRESAVRAQEQVDSISGKRIDLLAEYRKVQKELDIQKLYNAQIEAQIGVQEAKKLELRQSILHADRLQQQIPPLSSKMLESLESYIKLDLPFKTEARLEQVARVRQSLNSADIKPSEQLRQILELYDIEMQYSRTIDSFDEFIEIDGEPREVSVLRWGRMALIYLSLDETEVGIYDADQGFWRRLPASFRNAVRQGLRMARKQASLDMLLLPVPAPIEVALGDNP